MWRRVPCEQQLNMGQSALRDVRKNVWMDLVVLMHFQVIFPKGNPVKIPEPSLGDYVIVCSARGLYYNIIAATQPNPETSTVGSGRVFFSL